MQSFLLWDPPHREVSDLHKINSQSRPHYFNNCYIHQGLTHVFKTRNLTFLLILLTVKHLPKCQLPPCSFHCILYAQARAWFHVLSLFEIDLHAIASSMHDPVNSGIPALTRFKVVRDQLWKGELIFKCKLKGLTGFFSRGGGGGWWREGFFERNSDVN